MNYYKGRNDDRVSEFKDKVNKPDSGESPTKAKALSYSEGQPYDTTSKSMGTNRQPTMMGEVQPDQNYAAERPRTLQRQQERFAQMHPEFGDISKDNLGDFTNINWTENI